jgi:capsular polysaccharide transport system ATP-binding protein
MIRLDNVSFAYQRGRNELDRVTIELPSHRRMAILGGQETGKTTLIGLLAGVIDPTGGRIERLAHLSFPAGYNRAFRLANTVRQNVIFAARVYDADPGEVVDFICGILDLNDWIDRPMRDLPVQTRRSVAYALTYALPFDTYLFDNIIGPGDPATRDLWRVLYEARTATAGAVLATRQPRVAETYCDCALVLRRDAHPVFFENLREATALFEAEAAADQRANAVGHDQPAVDTPTFDEGSVGNQALAKVAD